jgi:hypothetical protein
MATQRGHDSLYMAVQSGNMETMTDLQVVTHIIDDDDEQWLQHTLDKVMSYYGMGVDVKVVGESQEKLTILVDALFKLGATPTGRLAD